MTDIIRKAAFFSFCFGLICLLFYPATVTAYREDFSVPYPSYTYDFWDETVPAPQAYRPVEVFYGEDLGVGPFSDLRDIHVGNYNNNLYVVDTGNNRIIIFDKDWNLLHEINSFSNEGQTDTFAAPHGVFVSESGLIYITDRNNSRIVVLNQEYELEKILGPPRAEVEGMIPEDFRYRPEQIAVVGDSRIFIIASEVYDGIMELDQDGHFLGYLGAADVSPSLWEYIWRRFSPQERRARLRLILPTEYSNMAIDDRGFVYTTASGGEISDEDIIRRLNSAGEDVLRRQGFNDPVGDYGSALQDASGEQIIDPTVFVDIIVRENGIYSALDQRRGRVFTYDNNGNLLYVFGGETRRRGTFRNPRALEEMGQQMIVLDGQAERLTLYEPTAYKQAIHTAIDFYEKGNYEAAVQKWNQVLHMNANYDLAYTGIGRGYLRQDYFERAMINFRLGENRQDYSRAFEHYRRDVLYDNFVIILIILFTFIFIVLVAIYYGTKIEQSLTARVDRLSGKIDRGKRAEGYLTRKVALVFSYLGDIFKKVLYSLSVITHPFSGFWELKHENRGNKVSATVIFLGVVLTYVISRQYTGFIFNPVDLTDLNIFVEFISIAVPFFLWCGVNWSLTTLMEGKGTFADIYISTAYALTPLIVIQLPLTVISNYLLLDEAMIYILLAGLAIGWTFFLIFFATLTVHQYTLPKTIFISILIIIGMVLTTFIGLLFFNLAEQVISFISDIYIELVYRI